MMLKGFISLYLLFFCGLLLASQVCSKKVHGNSAKEIVDIIKKNRTSIKLPSLYDNPGLGCMALQYAEECKDNCTTTNTVTCQPIEDDFTEVYAPNCGVELPTLGIVSGKLVGCWSKYLDPSEAFSKVLVRDKTTLSLVTNRTHTEVGVGVASTHNGHYFWCVLFSSSLRNSSFVLEDHGEGIKQKVGCFSGTNTSCSEASSMKGGRGCGSLLGIFFTSMFLYLMCRNVGVL